MGEYDDIYRDDPSEYFLYGSSNWNFFAAQKKIKQVVISKAEEFINKAIEEIRARKKEMPLVPYEDPEKFIPECVKIQAELLGMKEIPYNFQYAGRVKSFYDKLSSLEKIYDSIKISQEIKDSLAPDSVAMEIYKRFIALETRFDKLLLEPRKFLKEIMDRQLIQLNNKNEFECASYELKRFLVYEGFSKEKPQGRFGISLRDAKSCLEKMEGIRLALDTALQSEKTKS